MSYTTDQTSAVIYDLNTIHDQLQKDGRKEFIQFSYMGFRNLAKTHCGKDWKTKGYPWKTIKEILQNLLERNLCPFIGIPEEATKIWMSVGNRPVPAIACDDGEEITIYAEGLKDITGKDWTMTTCRKIFEFSRAHFTKQL